MRTQTTALVICLTTAASMMGETITVGPGESIQSAVERAAADDEIEIQPGVYRENIVIDSAKDHLKLIGMGSSPDDVIIDARPSGSDIGTGPGIKIDADDVEVENLTVRLARSDALGLQGHCIEIDADEVTLTGVRVERAQRRGIDVDGDDFVADGCVVVGNGEGGIEVVGDRATIKACEVRQHKDAGITVIGLAASVSKNVVIQSKEGQGIVIAGNDCSVASNEVASTLLEAIDITGNDATVKKNFVHGCGNDGIKVTGSKFSISKNEIAQLTFEGDGIRIANATSGTVLDNTITDTAETAIKLTGCSGVSIRQNDIRYCGTDKKPSISIAVSNASLVVADNRIRDGQGDGIRVEGDEHTIDGNKVLNCHEDGIDVEGGNHNTVSNNLVKSCRGEGIENNGTNTDVFLNTMKGNRIDLANSSFFGAIGNNTFETGGENVLPEVDE